MNDPFNNNQDTEQGQGQEQNKEMNFTMRDNINENSNSQMANDNMTPSDSMTNAGAVNHQQMANDNSNVTQMANDNIQPQNSQAADQSQGSTYHYSYVNNDNAANDNANHSNQREYVTYPNQNQQSAHNGYRPANYNYQQNGSQQANASNNMNSYASTNGYGYQNGRMAQEAPVKKKGKGAKVVKFVGGAVAFGAIAGCVMIGMNTAFNKLINKQASTTTHKTIATTTSALSSGSNKETNATASVVSSVMPSIVSITSTFQSDSANFNDFYYWFYGGNDSSSSEQTGSGSGFIISETDDQLMVVTNNHVISDDSYGDATKVQVTFSDETTVDATIKGTDPDADLAVLVVNKSDVSEDTMSKIKVAVLGDSESMNVGDDVIAIGNALGYGQSVTTGVVSALNREVQLTDKTMTLLQTDAAINPGNSGGALLNANGEVIGINTVKYASSEVEGMGYAIPMATAQPIIEELMNQETVEEGEESYLGIYGEDVDSELAANYSMPEGVWVSEVLEGSPAEKYGLQKRDIIVKFNDHEIGSMESLQNQLAKKKAGTVVTITVQRLNANGEYEDVQLEVTLGNKADAQTSSNSQNQQNQQGNGQGQQNQQNQQGYDQGQQDQQYGNGFFNR